jgi:hypothetical protein
MGLGFYPHLTNYLSVQANYLLVRLLFCVIIRHASPNNQTTSQNGCIVARDNSCAYRAAIRSRADSMASTPCRRGPRALPDEATTRLRWLTLCFRYCDNTSYPRPATWIDHGTGSRISFQSSRTIALSNRDRYRDSGWCYSGRMLGVGSRTGVRRNGLKRSGWIGCGCTRRCAQRAKG